jgi:hypothetical protein
MNTDEDVRRLPPPASGGSAPRGCSQERSRRSSPAEGTSRVRARPAALTCSSVRAGPAGLEAGAFTRPFSASRQEVSEGSTRRSCRRLTRPRRSSATVRASAKRGSRSTRSLRRAVKHGAVGGWMTARWSSAVLGRTAETPDSGSRSRCRTPAGFPTARGGQSPKVVFVAGARDAKRRL